MLQKMGYSWPVRKIAGAMTVTLVITDENTVQGLTKKFDLKISIFFFKFQPEKIENLDKRRYNH